MQHELGAGAKESRELEAFARKKSHDVWLEETSMLTDASFEKRVGVRLTDDTYLKEIVKGTSNHKKASKTHFLGLSSSTVQENETKGGFKPAMT